MLIQDNMPAKLPGKQCKVMNHVFIFDDDTAFAPLGRPAERLEMPGLFIGGGQRVFV